MKNYTYRIVANNFDSHGKMSAENLKSVSKQLIDFIKLRGSTSVKINIKSNGKTD